MGLLGPRASRAGAAWRRRPRYVPRGRTTDAGGPHAGRRSNRGRRGRNRPGIWGARGHRSDGRPPVPGGPAPRPHAAIDTEAAGRATSNAAHRCRASHRRCSGARAATHVSAAAIGDGHRGTGAFGRRRERRAQREFRIRWRGLIRSARRDGGGGIGEGRISGRTGCGRVRCVERAACARTTPARAGLGPAARDCHGRYRVSR